MSLSVGADHNLRIMHRESWDAAAAKQRIFAWAGWPKNPDPSKAKQAFFLYDASAPKLMGSYHDPFADVVNGELVAVDAGITAAASRLPQTDAPESEISRAVAIKDAYMKKIHGKQKSKSDADEDITAEMTITKASLGADGIMRWNATVSKFAADRQDDEVTREFYEKAATYVENGDYPMPALVISHFDDPRRESIQSGVPAIFKAGETTALYIDGNQPKAKGIFLDTPIGKALYAAVRKDMTERIPTDQKIRISMAFRPDYDNPEAVEKSDTGVIRYKSGHIRHFAATRVPIIEETNLMVQKSNIARKTKYEDAASIVGPELAAELDKEYKMLISVEKSDMADELIEKADSKHSSNGKFDMGGCITMVMGEGKPRKQAIAICLSKMRAKSGTEEDIDVIIEKMTPADMFDHSACMNEYTSKGLSEAAAVAICNNQMVKMMKHHMMEEKSMAGEQPELTDKEQEILKKAAIAIENGDVKALMDAVISDENVQVINEEVSSGTESSNAAASDTVSKSEESVAEQPKTAVNSEQEATPVEEKADMVEGAGESQVEKSEADAGVNGETVVTPEPTDSVAKLMSVYKAALADPSLDRAQKEAAVNMVLQGLHDNAKAEIKNVQPSANDLSTLIKAAVEDAVGPVVAENVVLKAQVQDLQTVLKNGAVDVIFQKPQSKQIPPLQQKADVTDNGGALTARQIADRTVTVSR